MELIRGISGIRGIVNQTLTNSVLTSHTLAFSKLQIEGSILLARDSRSHGKEFINNAAEIAYTVSLSLVKIMVVPWPVDVRAARRGPSDAWHFHE